MNNQEVIELRNVITNLSRRLERISNKNVNNENPADNRSLSPVLIREESRELPPISKNYKKTLHVNIYLY
jgi:hypothetical protein